MELALKIGVAIILVMMIWRLYPAAREQMRNGPKGTGKEWQSVALVLLAVAAFVVFLIFSVRG
ncbi:MAG: hypothetical protein PVG47_01850 [Chromatiales bacterium]|jgi:hypothetical protein|nr:hypothetical protein [Sedimenticolaceae bacterium]